jgi:hypothetical protein
MTTNHYNQDEGEAAALDWARSGSGSWQQTFPASPGSVIYLGLCVNNFWDLSKMSLKIFELGRLFNILGRTLDNSAGL